jgi:uncharacterized RDD family membrane protein YckC
MWYYIEDGQQRGPVLDGDLESLRREGKITHETMVWRNGMANWQRWGELQTGTSGSDHPDPVGAQVVCSQCGGVFSTGDVIRYGTATVCAACKPVFVQKLKEGANVLTVAMNFASFWIRLVALFVDIILAIILGMVVGFVSGFVGAMAGAAHDAGALAIVQLVATLAFWGLTAFYFIYFTGKSGQTPGKKLCGIRVVNADGSAVGYGKAAGRAMGYLLSSFVFCVGFLIAAFDEEKRALHDRLCNTRVVKV